jgi:hypothetical protein
MLGEEEGLSEDLLGHSSEWQSDKCGWVVRSGDDADLSSGENKYLHKRNPKKGEKMMQRWIMRLPLRFIGQRRGGRQYRGGETVDSE